MMYDLRRDRNVFLHGSKNDDRLKLATEVYPGRAGRCARGRHPCGAGYEGYSQNDVRNDEEYDAKGDGRRQTSRNMTEDDAELR